MTLGLRKNEVRLVDHAHWWHDEFNRIKKQLIDSTSMEERFIEHIGSTAINDMLAKPIIDILVAVDDLKNVDDHTINRLKDIGFLRLKVHKPEEIVFAKFRDDLLEEKTHFIHMVEFQKEVWNNLLFFRDYLNNNEHARKKYETIKLEYVRKSSTGIKEYTNHKEKFVLDICNKRQSFEDN
ncbi:GrpB family protein [Pseudogracilibacillus auburnensis]|uniref:GrpB family protein n=1 Tax=Pseudogracilibacillus auburnensis TaxID=1494959 RepID=UPI001A96640B|nr:GrpB family protein [Pseudogracilibacillus auburnensis]MBO1002857.1 GrpB family protein [Pseudogracilibacillus auburnensis]